jgi:hypothetical protein
MVADRNIDIPKFHSIVHYPEAIRTIGTLDGVSTQIVRGNLKY